MTPQSAPIRRRLFSFSHFLGALAHMHSGKRWRFGSFTSTVPPVQSLWSLFCCSNYFVLPSYRHLSTNRTHIALLELSLPFDMTEVSGMPKPDWYLKINPVSSIADDLFFLSIFWRHRSTSSCVCYIEKRGKVPALRIPTEQNAVIYESLSAMSFYVTTQQNCKCIIL